MKSNICIYVITYAYKDISIYIYIYTYQACRVRSARTVFRCNQENQALSHLRTPQVIGAKCFVASTCCQTLDAKYLVQASSTSIEYRVFGSKCMVPSTWYL